ncbi:protein translocase subunit SecD [Puniceicoccus vermicola]|uniref:Multifunctional fusion protein n=1 Tax=Puniceicoccus vermicola TaxID=388746 RepID=A0A7X1AVJ6_9BACT|nr:protein translocase subunit SecD [Puniceicoccus vermicola]MBC2600747.1 protein translocase subunit SecD [Puniceicoccus vermicola]
MSGGILWKAVLSVAILGWALLNLVPFEDREFGPYVVEQGSQEEVQALVDRASAGVEAGEYPSVYVGMREIVNAEGIDLASYFPEINLVDIRNQERRNEVLLRELLKRSKKNLRYGLDLEGGVSFTLQLDDEALADMNQFQRQDQLKQVVEVMQNRVNGLGVAEPVIRPVSDNSVQIQLPGMNLRDDPEGIESLRKPARLEFRLVNRDMVPSEGISAPLGYEALYIEEENQEGEIVERGYFVKRVAEATGSIVAKAGAMQNQSGGFQVYIDFTSEGDKRFAAITEKIVEGNNETGSVGQLAIVLDGELKSAPTVREVIRGGATISGRFSQREALELANTLNNPLEYELSVEEMSEVGPSLAADARDKSILAAEIGAGLVIVFMIAWYGLGGIVAVISIIVNVLIVLGVLASLGATLTLPGVAALVLTVGMAVDANILIFERVREELRAGKKTTSALLGGYDKAFSTIVDANVTTLITAGILIWLGSGPVKGFGVTLAIGICASVFCALVVSRFLLEILVYKAGVKKILGFSLPGPLSVDFLRFRKPAFLVSWLIVACGVFAIWSHWDHLFGIDFVGGDEIAVAYEEKIPISGIQSAANEGGFGEVTSVYQVNMIDDTESLTIQTEVGKGEEFFEALKAQHPEAGLVLEGQTSIGASVSEHIQRNAIISVGVALLGILLYIALRFEVGYGIGAVVATIHDVLMTIGIFVLADGQFSAPMIAAILMIVGYSINDTIVVFDRIREELTLNPTYTLKKVVNLAINMTLGRSILTSLTTFMAAFALYLAGSGIIVDFAFVFLIGIITGTFSSIYIASPIFYWWHKGDRKHVEDRELTPKYDWQTGSSE